MFDTRLSKPTIFNNSRCFSCKPCTVVILRVYSQCFVLSLDGFSPRVIICVNIFICFFSYIFIVQVVRIVNTISIKKKKKNCCLCLQVAVLHACPLTNNSFCSTTVHRDFLENIHVILRLLIEKIVLVFSVQRRNESAFIPYIIIEFSTGFRQNAER